MKKIARDELLILLKQKCPLLSDKYLREYTDMVVTSLDDRLWPNLVQWLNGEEVDDIWIGQYCVNAIMEIRNDDDFLDALYSLNRYIENEKEGNILIWRCKA